MIITISGKAGSGKGSVSKILSEKLWYRHISIGEMKRELATQMGLTISEFNVLWEQPENKESFDLKYEEFQKNLDLNDTILLDSRLWFYCQPKAFKVFLDVSDEEAAKRIFGDTARVGDDYDTLEQVYQVTKQRNIDDLERFKELYAIDISDKNNFDLVVSTDGKTVEETAQEIIEKFNQFQK